MIAHALALVMLWVRTLALPDASPLDATVMVAAAELEATPRAPAALLVSLAWGESRFQSTAQPRCGVLQVWPADLGVAPEQCAVWRSGVRAGVRAGVLELETMLADRRVHGDLRIALLYRACGNAAFTGGCTKAWWVDLALARFGDLAGRSIRGV